MSLDVRSNAHLPVAAFEVVELRRPRAPKRRLDALIRHGLAAWFGLLAALLLIHFGA